jgi:DNA-binding GntR family transcriptional regulator
VVLSLKRILLSNVLDVGMDTTYPSMNVSREVSIHVKFMTRLRLINALPVNLNSSSIPVELVPISPKQWTRIVLLLEKKTMSVPNVKMTNSL